MFFLSIAQIIFGANIQQYVTLQLLIVALIPPILFKLGEETSNPIVGIFAAGLALILEINHIRLYGSAGGVNAYIMNTELLTEFLLLLTCLFLIYFFNTQRIYWVILAGALLSLASLTRLNPLFIIPFISPFSPFFCIRLKEIKFQIVIIFLISFSVIFIPAQLSLTNQEGVPHALDKMENILRYRYDLETNSSSPHYEKQQPPMIQSTGMMIGILHSQNVTNLQTKTLRTPMIASLYLRT